MNNITIIFANEQNKYMTNICFNTPIGALSINGQSVIERLCLQCLSFSKHIIVVAGHNIKNFKYIERTLCNVRIVESIRYNYCSNNDLYSITLNEIANMDIDTVTVVEGDIVLSNSSLEKFISLNSKKKIAIIESKNLINNNQADFKKKKKISISDQYPKSLLGIITLPSDIIEDISNDKNGHISNTNLIDEIQKYMDDSYNTIHIEKSCKIITPDDYYFALKNTAFSRIPSTYSQEDRLELFYKFDKYVGIYDVFGGLIAQHCGLDGLWLGSYQICTSNGIKDDETYNPMIALGLAKQLKNQLVELPVIVDLGSGFLSDSDLIEFSSECNNTNIVAVCIDDNKNIRINSMFASGERQVLTEREFQMRLLKLRKYIPTKIKIIARTEIVTLYGEEIDLDILNKRIKSLNKDYVDAILPHYVGNNFDFIYKVLSKINYSKPLVLIPTGLLNINQKAFYDLGINLIIYANLDIRSRFACINKTYLSIVTSGTLDDLKISSLSSPNEIKSYIDIDF